MAKTIEYKPNPNKFDLRTHAWDGQGRLISKNLYRSFLIEGRQYFERPVNSGNLWFENNQPAGRVEYTFGESGKISSKEFKFDAPHKEWTAPLDGDEKLHYELEQTKEKNAQLEAEIASIKKELDKKQSALMAGTAKEATEIKTAPTLTKKEAK